MSTVGQLERVTQNRVVQLFTSEKRADSLGYRYLGNWQDLERTSNIEEGILSQFLRMRLGHSDALISRALFELKKIAGDQNKSLYEVNKEVYRLLRYGVKVREEVGDNKQTVWLVDWENPENNDFAIAEEVTVLGEHTKRPDLVIYVNGIALGVIELKRAKNDVATGIRQNLLNQKKEYIERFFTTMQLVMAGNDTQGLRYGTIETSEKYYLTWKEPSEIENRLDRHLTQMCNKKRFLEIIHDFIVFDSGVKKLCRPNQYFGVGAAEDFVKRREGGIVWHTQGSGKSLTMVWLTKWIREHVKDARVLIITDRTELDQQIEKVFHGVDEEIYRAKTGADLINVLNETTPWLMCSLIHKFGGKEDGQEVGDISQYLKDLTRSKPSDFKAKGEIFVFVDECHRTQSGELHKAMKSLLPNSTLIGFTGTPLLKNDKAKSIEIFGQYIHTYKFDEAVKDGVVLDLRYEARDIDQRITSPGRIDEWFDAKTRGLTEHAKAQLKQRWGKLSKVLSSQSRLEKIVADILFDMETRERLQNGHGNALLVSSSIYQACKYYELFSRTELAGKCAIVTSYKPSHRDVKDEIVGEGYTERLRKYSIYRKMLADWFNEPEDSAMQKPELFEKAVKKQFIENPGQMKLLIVVDKLLTGFDAPSATYLYIDKQMQDHGLFQAICRVNRLDGESKDYGYIIDYKDLFKCLEDSIDDYTREALGKYDKKDIEGLLKDRVGTAKEKLEEARESVKALCEDVEPPKDSQAFFNYFSCRDSGNGDQLKENEGKRLALYKHVSALVRAYANLANEMEEAGYTERESELIKEEVRYYENLRDEVKKHSGDAIDLKSYEPAMRHLIDSYIQADDSKKMSEFDDLSLVQLIVNRGVDAIDALPAGIKSDNTAVAETIENNVRRVIIDENPINPKYYEKMSDLLDDLISERRKESISYEEYLNRIVELSRQVCNPNGSVESYPSTMQSAAQKALYDNLDHDEALAISVHKAVNESRQDDWRGNPIKVKKVKLAIKRQLGAEDPRVDQILELVKNQNEY
ncbi:HsdR family type I site-specific deoxyribonuclease [bacterium]|nr:HsdR family type I site-specific deoxyribonuclease [bacterium]